MPFELIIGVIASGACLCGKKQSGCVCVSYVIHISSPCSTFHAVLLILQHLSLDVLRDGGEIEMKTNERKQKEGRRETKCNVIVILKLRVHSHNGESEEKSSQN